MTLFSLFGFKVRLHSSWIFLALLVAWSLAMGYFPAVQEGLSSSEYWLMGFLGVIGLFVSIVFHEFFHSIVARYYKMRMKGITLFIFGGIAEMKDDPPSPKAECLMAIAGPIASVFLWLAFGFLAFVGQIFDWRSSINVVNIYLSQINLILAIFNMIPAFPLDGGRVLRSILWSLKEDIRWATRWASRMGTILGFTLIALGVLGLFGGLGFASIWYILLGVFISVTAKTSYLRLVTKEMLQDESIERFLQPVTVWLSPEMNISMVLNDYFYKYRQRLFPVKSENKLVGCVNIHKISNISAKKRNTLRVEDVMEVCSSELSISTNVDAWQAYQKMIQYNTKELLVIDHQQVVGKIKIKELMEFLNLKLEVEEGRPVAA